PARIPCPALPARAGGAESGGRDAFQADRRAAGRSHPPRRADAQRAFVSRPATGERPRRSGGELGSCAHSAPPSRMKISKVEAIPLAIPYEHGLGRGKELDFCLVRVETDEGLVGWGEAFSYSCRSAVAAAVRDMIAPLALGAGAADIAGLHSTIQKRLHIFGRFGIAAFALSGLDLALWDIAAKAAGVPLHRLLGG